MSDPHTVRTCPACDTVQHEGSKLIKCVTCGVIYCHTCRLSRAYYHAHDCPVWRGEDVEREKLKLKPQDGICCACGDTGEHKDGEETECPAREDKTHCNHWWDGPRRETMTVQMSGDLLEIYDTIKVADIDGKELSYQELANEAHVPISKAHYFSQALVLLGLVEITDGRTKRNFARKWIRLKKDQPNVRTDDGRIRGLEAADGIQSDPSEG